MLLCDFWQIFTANSSLLKGYNTTKLYITEDYHKKIHVKCLIKQL